MITRRGFAIALLGIIILSSGYSLGNYFLLTMGIFFIFSTIIAYPILTLNSTFVNLTVERTLDKEKVFAGDFIYVTVKVTNKTNRPLTDVEIFDTYPEIFNLVLGSNKIRTRLGRGESITFSYILQCPIRGLFTLGPTQILFHDTFGYHFDSAVISSETPILVYPTYEDIKKLKAMAQKRRLGLMFGIHKTKIKGMGTDFYGIRPYDPSDELRYVDWKATARTGQLRTKEFESEKNIRVMVLLDVSSSMGAGATLENKLEYGIRAALLLSHLALERRDLVGLTTFSDEVEGIIEPRTGKTHFYRILELLAEVIPHGGKNYLEAAKFSNRYLKRGALVILISDLEGNVKNLKEALKFLRANEHNILIIAPFGPWFEVKRTELSPLDKALVEATSFQLWRERKEIIKDLTRMGIDVINVGPDDFLPVVVSTYMKAKKKGIGAV